MSYIDPTSFGRFHKKGFKGHVVKKPGEGKKPNKKWFYPPEMTNKERYEWRKERRQKLREQAENATIKP